MKSPILALPILLEVALIVALYTHRDWTATLLPPPTQRAADIRALRVQRDRIAARLAVLECMPKTFLPRGIGAVTSNSSHADRRNN